MATPPLVLDEPHGDTSGLCGGEGEGLNRQSRLLLKRPPAVKISRLQTGLSVSARPRSLASRAAN